MDKELKSVGIYPHVHFPGHLLTKTASEMEHGSHDFMADMCTGMNI